ncbi:MAG: RidA family protein [Chloroflexia bacterium]|nr:RidA family protein [Chloroflexia bacterium]
MAVERRAVNPWTWQDQFGFVQANEVKGIERVLICSGQTAMSADGQPQHPGDMRAQVALALDNLETVLREAGLDWSNVVRLNHYTTDMDAFFQAADVLGSRLGGIQAASTVLGVTRLAFPELMIEMEAMAVA